MSWRGEKQWTKSCGKIDSERSASSRTPPLKARENRRRAAVLGRDQDTALGGLVCAGGAGAAALYDPVFTSAVRGWPDLAVAAAGFALLQWLKAPAWLVVLIVGAAGAGLVLAGFAGPVH
ncbi:MAG: hypothetical protein FD124_1714 [Alphaproteobacteria bacterium]|nr:MAG: hypothetical protein FD160_3077 [Caulobacteraceae bacterium]TPW06470.1 MAG: hypothetical protein FD124_1714 [Alphaproteobacteria bacterium]